jgi:hypothetical protein
MRKVGYYPAVNMGMRRREFTLTKRNELERITSSLNEVSNKINDYYENRFALEKKSNSLITEVILEEELLKGTEWKLCLSGNNNAYLEFIHDSDHPSLKGVAQLTRDSFHGSFQLPENVDLHYDESVVTLHFDDPGLIQPFIQKTGILVDTAGVSAKLHDLKRQVKALESIAHSLSL